MCLFRLFTILQRKDASLHALADPIAHGCHREHLLVLPREATAASVTRIATQMSQVQEQMREKITSEFLNDSALPNSRDEAGRAAGEQQHLALPWQHHIYMTRPLLARGGEMPSKKAVERLREGKNARRTRHSAHWKMRSGSPPKTFSAVCCGVLRSALNYIRRLLFYSVLFFAKSRASRSEVLAETREERECCRDVIITRRCV